MHPISLAAFGRLDLLFNLRDPILLMPKFFDHEVRQVTPEYGHVNILEALGEWFLAVSCKFELPWEGIATAAALSGQLQVLKWWLARYYPLEVLLDEDNAQFFATMWWHLANAAMETDQAQVLEWILASANARHRMIDVTWQLHNVDEVQLMVRDACRHERYRCLQFLHVLGMVSPFMLTAEQVGDLSPWAKGWWNTHMYLAPQCGVNEADEDNKCLSSLCYLSISVLSHCTPSYLANRIHL
ncbi:hypothetical protein BCR44DRAFT_398098 [Catenaria anguillulae PL171]|uniref:Uncharacterized protein n=1 Tax=Catenaria anguillulae PL171 TaxID=765915 RepID=A0A1Y2HML2_9FUNG|nr:hypothetical protein BCR44DRAFT_398098 [Catenaria anguillulae PL171]